MIEGQEQRLRKVELRGGVVGFRADFDARAVVVFRDEARDITQHAQTAQGHGGDGFAVQGADRRPAQVDRCSRRAVEVQTQAQHLSGGYGHAREERGAIGRGGHLHGRRVGLFVAHAEVEEKPDCRRVV